MYLDILTNYREPKVINKVLEVKGRLINMNKIKTTEHSVVLLGAPSGTRTRGPLIKSQLLYHLS